MSNTFTRKVHKGEIQKRINEIERKKKEAEEEEALEALRWKEGSKETTGHDLRILKEEEKRKHKEQLKELYEKEMNQE